MNRSRRIGIVAGEASGDILGAGLIEALRAQHPELQFEGIGGPRMQAQGLVSFYPLDRLSVMGLVDPIKRLPELLRMRRNLVRHFVAEPPAVFIGIDSPDFNLGIEAALRQTGIRTAHYVSPSVWAWRQGRVKKIARAVDLMLTLFPFEADFYRQHQIPVEFVGHPLADDFSLEVDTHAARQQLGCAQEGKLVAVLPGSRAGEVNLLGPIFIEAMQAIVAKVPGCRFILPAANEDRYRQLQGQLQTAVTPLTDKVLLLRGQSREAMAAADVVMMTSGTTTLEAMLLKKPMVVAYKLSPLSYSILSRLVKTDFIALPNLLASEAVVPELVQEAVSAEALAREVCGWLDDVPRVRKLQHRFDTIHRELRRNASVRAAAAVQQLLVKS